MKYRLFLTAAALTVAMTMPAQPSERTIPAGGHLKTVKSSVVHRDQARWAKAYPLLAKRKSLLSASPGAKSPFAHPMQKPLTGPLRPVSPGVPAKAGYLPTLYGEMVDPSEYTYNWVSLSPVVPFNYHKIAELDGNYFNGGGALIDGVMHGVGYMQLYGMTLVVYYQIDAETGALKSQKQLFDMSLIAMETATDARGRVFGEFYDASAQKLEYGFVDYASQTRTTVAEAKHYMLAMGFGADGYVYGVDDQADLYRIDTTTGEETRVGNTGAAKGLLDHQGQSYLQSGEIDPKSGTFYWARCDSSAMNAIYTVDLETGAATKVVDMGMRGLMVMSIPAPNADATAPGAVTDLSLHFEGASTTGSVVFTLPDRAFDGTTPLTGTLTYSIYVNGQAARQGEARPGARVTEEMTLAQGMNEIEVTVTNSMGEGPGQKQSAYIGYDQPMAPRQAVLSLDGSGSATLSWNPSEQGVHGGYMGTVTYNVYSVDGDTYSAVAQNLTDTVAQFRVNIGQLHRYVYAVEAVNGTEASARTRSNGIVLGSAIEPPFFDDFKDGIDLYTVADVNNDERTWKWYAANHSVRYRYSSVNAADDWLFTPPVKLQGGKTYTLSYKVRSEGSEYPEKLEVKWGGQDAPEGMAEPLLKTTTVASAQYTVYSHKLSPAADGNYYVGFHAISDADSYCLYLDSLKIEKDAEGTAPAPVTGLAATADKGGALQATVTFTLPVKTVGGETLTTITKAELLRGDDIIKEWGGGDNLAPGAALSYTDNGARLGNNTYTVRLYNESGRGEEARVTVYVGVGVPAPPTISKIRDDKYDVTLTWDAAKAANRGIILPEKVSYEVYDVTSDGFVGERLDSLAAGTQSYTVRNVNTDLGNTQHYAYWAIRAINEAGASEYGTAALIAGQPYRVPYHNSLKDAGLEGKFIAIDRSAPSFQWGVVDDVTSDNDGGALAFTTSLPGQGALLLGKMAFDGTDAPTMVFSYRAEAIEGTKLALAAQTPDGEVSDYLWEKDLGKGTGTKWEQAVIRLPESLKDAHYVILRLTGISTKDMRGRRVYVDNINVLDPLQKDASVAVASTPSVNKGQTAKVTVTVNNEGLEPVTGARVALKLGDEVLDERTLDATLTTMQNVQYTVDYKTTSLSEAIGVVFTATLTLDGDMDLANDEAEAVTRMKDADVAAPEGLTKESDNPVVLSWSTPQNSTQQVADGFEDYEAWEVDNFGDWSVVKRDEGYAGGISEQIAMPHQGEAYGFINMQPQDYFTLNAHGGDKCLAAFYQVNAAVDDYVASDAWLISPQLSGRAQTISFWVNNVEGDGNYGTENYEVWYSLSDNNPDNFVKIGGTRQQASAQWTLCTEQLPEGAAYFAVRHCTPAEDALCIMLDDFTFERGATPVAYNVYRDGVLVASITATTFTEPNPDGLAHEYKVTAVYADGSESKPVAVTVAMSISSLERAGVAPSDVYTLDGRLVLQGAESLRSLKPGVYVIRGQKTIVTK